MKEACKHAIVLLVVLSAFCVPVMTFADVPQKINYQGRLLGSSGTPMPDGDYYITFTIWKHETSTLSTDSLWSSGEQTVLSRPDCSPTILVHR
jgi:hypothetical protein